MSRNPRSAESPISPTSRPLPRHSASKSNVQRPVAQFTRTSTAGSSHSIASTLETAPSTAIAEAHDNAISNLLQNPIVRTGLNPQSSAPSSLRFPTSREIPPVTLTTIPPVENSVFKTYLEQAGGLYDVFRKSKETGEDAKRPSIVRSAKPDDLASDGIGPGMHRRLSGTPTRVRTDSSESLDGPISQHRRRSSGGAQRRNPMAAAPLSTIPSVYFEEDFRLENPRTFDIVSEKSEIAPSADGAMSPGSPGGSGKKALAANAILQEKLSWYMDTVEIHLISSISTASTSFFAALGSLRGLQEEAGDSVDKIQRLRRDLSELDQGMAVGGLDIIAKKRRRENLRRLTDAVEQLELVARCISECEDQVDSGEIENALAGLADVESLIAGEMPRQQNRKKHPAFDFQGAFIDLSNIKALKEVTQGIGLLRLKIGKAYETKFMQLLLQDLKNHIDNASSVTTLLRLEKASNRLHGRQHRRMPSETENPAYQMVNPDLRAALREDLKGLAKSESATRAVEEYRKNIVKEFKNIVRRHIPSSSEDDAESMASVATHDSRSRHPREKGAVLRQNLRAMDQDDAIEMLKNIYCDIAEGLRRLGTQSRELLDITSKLENPQPAFSPRGTISPRSSIGGHSGQSLEERLMRSPNLRSPGTPPVPILHEEIQRALNIQSLLGEAVRLSEKHVKPVLRARVEQTTTMDLPHFLQYFALNRLFADECEAVSGFGLPELKATVNDHIKSFVSHVAEDERKELVKKMDADKWDARDFSEQHIERLARIIHSGTADLEEWTKLGSLFDDSQSTPKAVQNGTFPSEIPKDTPSTKEKVRSAVVDDEKYILPESAMVVAAGIESFMKLLIGMESLGTEVCSGMLDYIKLFNSRSSQLILGAGATRSAGLKNITTKHLALSSQGLSFVVAIIPYVREYSRRHLPKSSALLTEFDKVKRLLQEHQSGIHDKLVEIMTGRATAHVNSMKKIEWDHAEAPAEVNKYMETLMKETATLHKVLTRHLPSSSVAMIMQPVLAGYQDQWSRAFNNVEVKTTAGKERLVRDADYFRTRMSKIEGAGTIGDSILNIAKEKTVEAPSKPTASETETETKDDNETKDKAENDDAPKEG